MDPVLAASIGGIAGAVAATVGSIYLSRVEYKRQSAHRWDDVKRHLYANFLVQADIARNAHDRYLRARKWLDDPATSLESELWSPDAAEEGDYEMLLSLRAEEERQRAARARSDQATAKAEMDRLISEMEIVAPFIVHASAILLRYAHSMAAGDFDEGRQSFLSRAKADLEGPRPRKRLFRRPG